MKDYQEAFKQEFGIHFFESELQFALAFIEEVYQAGRDSVNHLPDRPLNSDRE